MSTIETLIVWLAVFWAAAIALVGYLSLPKRRSTE